ncbi:hypothetical protein [Leminorella grimontii]|uniref:hypothetical protein n=1 Tax=Leminorella grimontii TaxID=82981 RepID=UPI00321FB301
MTDSNAQTKRFHKPILFILAAVIVGGIAFYIATPSSPPSCSKPSLNETLSKMYLRANIEDAISNPGRALSSDNRPIFYKLKNQAEVSYDSTTRTRYCTATAMFILRDESQKRETVDYDIGYIISPKGDDFQIQMKDKDYITHTYGKKSEKSASPIGEQKIKDALMASVKKLDGASRAMPKKIKSMSESVEWTALNGECVKQADGYTCPLIVGFYDNLLNALGRNSNLKLYIDLPLIQEDGVWKTTDAFNDIFLKSIVRARMINMYGEEAVKKAEQQEQSPTASGEK